MRNGVLTLEGKKYIFFAAQNMYHHNRRVGADYLIASLMKHRANGDAEGIERVRKLLGSVLEYFETANDREYVAEVTRALHEDAAAQYAAPSRAAKADYEAG